jgi:hypothetical protein
VYLFFFTKLVIIDRLVIANVLGSPEREDWKNCSQTEEEEKACAIQFKEAFKPFDFTLDE